MKIEQNNDTERRTKLKFLNGVVHYHDMICCCGKPLQHSVDIIFEIEPKIDLPEETKKKIQKCLSTDGGDPVGEDDFAGFLDGELDMLFAQDDGEKDVATTTG